MAEECEYTTEMEPDQREDYGEACGGNTLVSALVLADIIKGARWIISQTICRIRDVNDAFRKTFAPA
jgi:hypothetical protein